MHLHKKIPFKVLDEFDGEKLIGIRYEQLIPWVKPDGDAFRVIAGDYVTTEDGTGIVHIAPTFGADDNRVGKEAGIAPLLLIDKDGKQQPMVYPHQALDHHPSVFHHTRFLHTCRKTHYRYQCLHWFSQMKDRDL